MRWFYGKLLDIWLLANASLMIILVLLVLVRAKLAEEIAPIFLISTFSMLVFIVVIGLYYVIKDKYGK